MESAIPSHLECLRTRQRRMPDDYEPPYPSFVARFKRAYLRLHIVSSGVEDVKET